MALSANNDVSLANEININKFMHIVYFIQILSAVLRNNRSWKQNTSLVGNLGMQSCGMLLRLLEDLNAMLFECYQMLISISSV